MTNTRERRWWTKSEDEILKSGVKTQYGSAQNWNDIAMLLPGRTNKDCRKRWSKIQLDIRKGPWTRAEDDSLRQAVQQFGLKWSQVAIVVRSRNADQCAKRWQHVLGPDFKHCPWSSEEDSKLLDGMRRHINNWKQIGLTDLPDRSPHDIRNRSLLLGRRQRNHHTSSENPVVGQKSDPNFAEPDTISENGDAEVYDGSSVSDETASVSVFHSQASEINISQPQTPSSAHGIAFSRSQQPLTPLTRNDTGNPCPHMSWTGSASQLQPYPELSTPSGDVMLSLDSFEVDPSSWLPIDEEMFNEQEALDFRVFDMPELCDGKSDKARVEEDDIVSERKSRGKVTVTLTQVDPDIALEIMGNVLRYSECLKIQCIVNDA